MKLYCDLQDVAASKYSQQANYNEIPSKRGKRKKDAVPHKDHGH
jgi:hypothetical protein